MIQKLIVLGVTTLFSLAANSQSEIKLDCNFVKPEMRSTGAKFRADVDIDLASKTINMFGENNLGSQKSLWRIDSVSDKFISARLVSPKLNTTSANDPIIFDRYKSILIMPDRRVADCVALKKSF